MRLQYAQLPTLLGSLVLCAGLTTTLASAQDKEESDGDISKVVEETQQISDGEQAELDSKTDEHEGMVQVRVSLPDGRTIVTYEKKAARSARVSPEIARQVSRFRASASSARSSTHSSSGQGRASSGGSSVQGGNVSSGSSGGGRAGVASFSGSKAGSSSGSSAPSSSSANAGASASGKSSSSGSSNRASTGGGGGSASATGSRSVPTVGNARHSAEGAIGGQRVEFHDAGMGAAVVGNTVYFTGVQLVQANQDFQTIEGTRIGADTVIMQDGRLSPDGSGPLSSWNTGASAIKLDFASNTVVDLVMFSQAENASNPERIQRTWTVRIR